MPVTAFRQTALGLSVAFSVLFPIEALALKIVDYQRRLNPRFHKQVRPETHFIIIHSTESSLPSALRTLSQGKVWRGRYVTRGGHAHYLIAKDGAVYRIMDPKYWANHAGVSMWKGFEGLSDYSIGIELEGYHNVPFSDKQYRSLRKLLEVLQKRYQIEDRDVLEHYRIAYSSPNEHHGDKMRGRKLDPGFDNFDRLKAGLSDAYSADPDVIAGRINVLPTLIKAGGHVTATAEVDGHEETLETVRSENEGTQITSSRTAWQIAGVQYNSPTTLYRFPDGRTLPGDQIPSWSEMPPGTQVSVAVATNQVKKIVNPIRAEVIVPEITSKQSPWKIANALYNSSITFYILPDGRVLQGSDIPQVTNIPDGSKVLVAYREIAKPQTRFPVGEDLAAIYLAPQTLYLFPERTLRSGDQIEDFTKLPADLRVFAKMD